FELVWDSNRASHLRELAPIARRVLLDDRQVVAATTTRPVGAELRGNVLFILSPAQGSLAMGGFQFGESDTFDAQPLQYIEKELDQLKKVRARAGLSAPDELLLSEDDEAIDLVLNRLAEQPWDIVHFAGHSVCADNGEVFLLLPGPDGP